ncbi:MAG: SDR family oxidoreductase [Acidobacteria bacterium]|nr:MAG: SDR family oxidoreductase [Acidobacteriota bacterium]
MFRDDLLRDQTILITGGGSGLGRAMAERCAGLEAAVAVVGRRPGPLEETADALRDGGGRAAWASCDVRDPQQLAAATERLEEELGPFTALVNNAAGNFLAPSEDLSANAFDTVVKIVLYGTFHATQLLGRRWIERRSGGVVLSILTPYAWMGSPFVLPSACAKAGVLALTRSLAIEWATYGIRLNAIAPGPFPTDGAFSRLMPPGMAEAAKRANPLGRFGEPAELADLAAFLLSPMAAYVNGECVTIDGGQWLKQGQEFGGFTDLPRDQVKATMAAMRPGKRG